MELLELKESLKIKLLLSKETLELQDVEVVDVGEVAEETNLQRVDVEEVVEVDLVESLEAVEGIDIESEGTLVNLTAGGSSGRSSGNHGGEGRDDDSEELHFD